MNFEDFTKRFNELVGENRSDFSFKTLVPYTTITNVQKGTDPRVSMILTILESLPDISAEWLMRGDGTMTKQRGDINLLSSRVKVLEEENEKLKNKLSILDEMYEQKCVEIIDLRQKVSNSVASEKNEESK